MNTTLGTAALSLSILVVSHSAHAAGMVSVAYGTITGVGQQEKETAGGKTGGAVLGGMVGLYSGKGKSGSNKALRTMGGATVGSAVGGTMAKGMDTVYTVSMVEGGAVRIVMDGNFRTGNCVAVERGGPSANLRRVSEEFCRNSGGALQPYKVEHKREAGECAQAKEQLLAAQTEESVKTAQMKMNILCQD